MRASVLVVWLYLGTLRSLVTGLSSVVIRQRRTELVPWINKSADHVDVLGWTLEKQASTQRQQMEVKVHWQQDSEGDSVTVTIPTFHEASGSLGSTLWPAGLAGAVLMRSPVLRQYLRGKDVLELGCGLGLAGLTVATSSANKCFLSDNDSSVIQLLQDHLGSVVYHQEEGESCLVATKLMDWRDSRPEEGMGEQEPVVDVAIGTDVAYYFHLLVPFMDTVKSHLKVENSLLMVIGQANRSSLWDLFDNIVQGCYNQRTDQREDPWRGKTQMLLYKLHVYEWEEHQLSPGDLLSVQPPGKFNCEGTIPIAVLMYLSPGLQMPPLTDFDYVATQKDREQMTFSF